jgi:agmatinase
MTIADGITGVPDGRPSLFGWLDWRDDMRDTWALCALGVPTDRGNVISRGAARGPAAIRHATLQLAAPPISGLDIGDIDAIDMHDPEQFMRRIATATDWVYQRGLCPLILGGDHSITYAPVSALQQSRDLCLIWFDAHTDFSPWLDQEFHNHKQVLRRISKLEGVSRIVQIGYRGITVGDERSLGNKSVVVPTAHARRLDARALLELVPRELPCYVSIDIDVVDPFCAPGTSAPVPDGLLPKQMKSMLQALVRHREILGIDLVEVNPTLDSESATSLVAAGLIRDIAEEWSHQWALAKSRTVTLGSKSAQQSNAYLTTAANGSAACETH